MVLCDNVPDVQNGNRLPSKDSVTCGTKVRYTCNEGFTVEGDSVLECVVGGELRGQVPVCKAPGNFQLNFILSSHLAWKYSGSSQIRLSLDIT